MCGQESGAGDCLGTKLAMQSSICYWVKGKKMCMWSAISGLNIAEYSSPFFSVDDGQKVLTQILAVTTVSMELASLEASYMKCRVIERCQVNEIILPNL